MIKPETLYNFGKTCRNSVVAGNVLRALCRQSVELSEYERNMVDMIQNDSEWMDERIEEKRAKERERKRTYRKGECPEMSHGQSGTPECPADKVSVPCFPHHPSIHPSTHPSNQSSKHINRPDPDKINEPVKGVIGGNGASGSASGSGRYKFGEVFGWDDERLFSCDYGKSNVLEMYRCAFGKGMWAGALRELGDDTMLEALSAMCHEERAGEGANNPAAAMTKRLQKLLDAKGVKA